MSVASTNSTAGVLGVWVNRSWWALAGGLLTLHFVVVVGCSVNLPFWDDWDVLFPGRLDRELNLDWVFSFHNTHRNVWTHLSVWLLYRAGGWNLNTHIALNFLLYATVLIGTLRWLERSLGVQLGALALYGATALADEVHLHAFNGCWSFVMGFFALAVATTTHQSWRGWIAPVAAIASVYGAGGGLVCAAVWVAYVTALAFIERPRRAFHLARAALCVIGMGLWFRGAPGADAPTTPPWVWGYWEHLFNILSLGLGFREHVTWPGVALMLALLLFCGAWLVLLRRGAAGVETATVLGVMTLAVGLLGSMGAISYGRAWAGPGGAKSGRYAIACLFLMPVVWALGRAWLARALPDRRQLAVAGVLLMIVLWPLRDDFDFRGIYEPLQARRLDGVRCLRESLRTRAGLFCPSINPYGPASAAPFEQRAIQLGLSYVREQGS